MTGGRRGSAGRLQLVGGVLELVEMGQTEVGATLVVNTVLRFTVVAVFLAAWWAGRHHQTPGTNR
jgi:hypothetical protein